MLNWLIALILLAMLSLAQAVYSATPLPAVVTASMVAAFLRCASMHTDSDVTTRFVRDTARAGRATDENHDGHAEGRRCRGNGAVTPAGADCRAGRRWFLNRDAKCLQT